MAASAWWAHSPTETTFLPRCDDGPALRLHTRKKSLLDAPSCAAQAFQTHSWVYLCPKHSSHFLRRRRRRLRSEHGGFAQSNSAIWLRWGPQFHSGCQSRNSPHWLYKSFNCNQLIALKRCASSTHAAAVQVKGPSVSQSVQLESSSKSFALTGAVIPPLEWRYLAGFGEAVEMGSWMVFAVSLKLGEACRTLGLGGFTMQHSLCWTRDSFHLWCLWNVLIKQRNFFTG